MHCQSHTLFFFFNDTATTEIYTLSLHDALPIWRETKRPGYRCRRRRRRTASRVRSGGAAPQPWMRATPEPTQTSVGRDRKSTRLNSSHANISYAVFCLKKKKTSEMQHTS